MSAYKELEAHFKKLSNLGHCSAIVGWDEQVMMPTGGGEARADAMATLTMVIHGMAIDPRIGDLLATAEADISELDEWQLANLREMKHSYKSDTALPPDLVMAIEKARLTSQQAWRTMRAENNWKDFLPLQKETFNLIKESAIVLGEKLDLTPHDALIDYFDPGMTTAKIDPIFAELGTFLPDFIEEVMEAQRARPITPMVGTFSVAKQKALGLKLMEIIGFDFDHGRLDVSHHPFCGGVAEDVRITTRYDEEDFLSSLMGIMHETGHARYDQCLPAEWRGQPVGNAMGMSIHESQSLFVEFQICKSKEFLEFAAPIIREYLGDSLISWLPIKAENLYRICTEVKPGLIRVDADEVTYPLHIMLRYEIERGLISGDLRIEDIPEAWDAGMQKVLGLSTKGDFKNGCMQDVHWPSGAFGYFPSYTLGALRAAQFMDAVRAAHPNAFSRIANGDFSTIGDWLIKNIRSKGRLLEEEDLMIHATGAPLDPQFFKDHLKNRYLP